MFRKFAVVVFLSMLFLGCVIPTEPTVPGGLTIKQGTVGGAGNLSIGVVSVHADSATLALWDGTVEETFELKVGEEAEFQGCTIKVLGVYVDPFPTLVPGSSGSRVTLQVNCTRAG